MINEDNYRDNLLYLDATEYDEVAHETCEHCLECPCVCNDINDAEYDEFIENHDTEQG